VGTLGWQLSGVVPAVSANGVGEISALLAIVALARLVVRDQATARRALYGLLFQGSLLTLILSQTRSALTAFAFGVAVLLFFSKRVGLIAFTAVGVVLAAFQTTLGGTLLSYFLRGQDRQMFGSLSGRTDWWVYAWSKFLERPWTGWGAYAGGRFVAMADLGDSSTSSIHSTYIEVLLGTSVWGLLPVLALLAGAWWLLIRGLNRSEPGIERQLALEALAVLGVITVRSLFTTHLIWHASALPFLLVLGYAEFMRRRPLWALLRRHTVVDAQQEGTLC
jgi:O-antigen ligase